MKSDAVAFGIAGVLFGLIAGWVIGSQLAVRRPPAAAAPAAQQAPASGGAGTSRAAVLDESQVNALKTVAEREASNATPRAARQPTSMASGTTRRSSGTARR
jgi:hypothetical protein